eukprot:COSAG06_NODE_11237_length_1541_cov_0.920943_1_plen_238_part_10
MAAPVRFAVVGSNFITDAFLKASKSVPGFQLAAVYRCARAAPRCPRPCHEPLLTIATDGLGWTALHWAARGGHEGTAALLVRHGTPLDVQSTGIPRGREGYTPLHEAATHGHLEVTRLLLLAGADTAIETQQGETPHLVAKLQGHPAVAALLASPPPTTTALGLCQARQRLAFARGILLRNNVSLPYDVLQALCEGPTKPPKAVVFAATKEQKMMTTPSHDSPSTSSASAPSSPRRRQ